MITFIPPEGAMQFELTWSPIGPVSIPMWVGPRERYMSPEKKCKCRFGWVVLDAPTLKGTNQKRAAKLGFRLFVCKCMGRIIE